MCVLREAALSPGWPLGPWNPFGPGAPGYPAPPPSPGSPIIPREDKRQDNITGITGYIAQSSIKGFKLQMEAQRVGSWIPRLEDTTIATIINLSPVALNLLSSFREAVSVVNSV